MGVRQATRIRTRLTRTTPSMAYPQKVAGLRPGMTTWEIEDDLKARHPGLELELSEHRGYLTLGRIVVPREQRCRGIGGSVLTELAEHADRMGWTMVLSPSDSFGGMKARLQRFYGRYGFKRNYGSSRYRDFSTQEAMVRAPKGQLTSGSAPTSEELR